MNYSGNMPDWHQYNPQQSSINNITSTAQNVNSGHLSFISSISPTCSTQLNSLNLSSEGLDKHQNDPNFNPRHFQPHLSGNIAHGHNAADNTPLASMVQMQNCIGHYGPSNTRNPMVDNLNGPMDPRSTAISGLNEELSYRNNQVPLNGPISHLNGPNMMNMNASHASIGPRNTNVNSHTNRTGPPPSFVPCKGLCCNPDPNISYQQWEKYCSYQNNTAYRESIRSSAGYQTDTRRAFGSDFNFRKDNFDGKEVLPPIAPPPPPPPPPNAPNTDHRRNFTDFKYRKDRLIARNYPPSSGMLQNYSVQNYNYNAGEYQKYPYNIKEYSKVGGMNVPPNQTMVKHQEQSFAMPQQKYNGKQVPYPSNAGVMPGSMPSTSVPNPSMIPSAQNTYFNSQYPRNLPTDISHDCQETADNVSMVNRMQSSVHNPPPHSRYQMYQQKIAMQKFSMENDLRELSRIPGYQSHPKYKEYIHKYREILKLQQSVTYQGQMQQTSSCVAATSNVTTSTVPSINLQFDQNGVLINSNYIPEAFSRMQQVANQQQTPMDVTVDKQGKPDGGSVPEMASHNMQKPQQHDGRAITLCPGDIPKQDRYPAQKSLNRNQFEVQKTADGENFGNLGTGASDAVVRHKMTKEFPDKPELDVRQFLANWDESEDEDGASTALPNAVLSDSTPVVVVGYENLSTKTLEGLEVSKPEEITSGVITFESRDKSNAGVIPAQDCLTISYSTAENVEIAKDSACKEITKESIVRTGGHIIQCISNGPDEVPTIHIVDNLEIGSILQVTNGQVGETLGRQDAVSFFQEGTEAETASAITLEPDELKTGNSDEPTATEYNNGDETLNKKKYIVESSSLVEVAETTSQASQMNGQKMVTLSASVKDNSDSTQEMNLKKQSSFASEESHNPDDISLPDLPTSECTPISTTLNTPIHSDNEESSERVQDLTISTNPIEVMQNSPIISFAQSPTKERLYDHLSDEKTVKNKPTNPLADEYRTGESHFKNESNDTLDQDAVLGTFEFSASTDKNNSTAKNGKRYACENAASTNINEKASFSANNEIEKNTEVADMRVTLASGEYELKIVSASTHKTMSKNYENSTTDSRFITESQVTVTNQDASLIHKNSEVLPEESSKVTLRFSDSVELENALQNITSDPDSAVLDGGEDDVVYSEKCVPTESARQTATNPNTISLSTTGDTIAGDSRIEDGCAAKSSESGLSISPSTIHSTSSGDKIKKREAPTSDKFSREDSFSKNDVNGNKSANVDAKDSKQSRHTRLEDSEKSTSKDQAASAEKRCWSGNTEKSSETIHHGKHTQETESHKGVERVRESDSSRNKPKVIGNVRIDDAAERMRFLKEYRRIKSKPSGDAQTKTKDTPEASDCRTVSKKCHLPSSSNERSALPNDSCQKDTVKLKLPEKEERKHANVLRTLVTKNVSPADFAIQVTNVNLKLKDTSDHQKDSHHGEEGKNSLDGIKIEINVSCTERNTTEKLLHENIKNAVAETIGHLTGSISSGARSSSTSITEIPCDKKVARDNADCRDYERHTLGESSSALTEAPAYNSVTKDQNNTDETKHKLAIATWKEGATGENETSASLVSRKRQTLSSEQTTSASDMHVDNGNVKTESAPSSSEAPKSEHAMVRRRSIHHDTERKIANSCVTNEESIISSDNSASKSVNVQKKEHQEITSALCGSARNSQDDAASRLNATPSTSSSAANPSAEGGAAYDNAVHFDYDHFDVAPNESADTSEKRSDRWKRSKRDDDRFDDFDLYETPSGYINPSFFSADKLENLNTVPVYTTKDGKITYSPNPRFTYRELLMEARAREGHAREPYFARSPPYDYYNCSKLRKIFKRSRDVTDRKRETDLADAKPAAKHTDYPKSTAYKSAHCKFRVTSHLEFFNDDADKLLYTNKSNQQETKESNKKNIIGLKQFNLDGETASSSKHCKAKVHPDNLGREKGYSENSVFDSNLFLGPKAGCWEETMESVKSYSSHIDRRNNDNLKELSFSEIFARNRLDTFSFLSAERAFESHKTNYTESTLHRDPEVRSRLLRDNSLQREQPDTVSREEQNNEDNKNDASTAAKSATDIPDALLIVQRNNEDTGKRESGEIQSSAILLTEEARSRSPKIADENIDSERDRCLTGINDKEMLTERPTTESNTQIRCTTFPEENNLEDAEQASDKNSVRVASLFESSTDPKDPLGEEERAETTKGSAFGIHEQDDEMKDTAEDNLESTMSQETLCHQVTAVIDCEDKKEDASEPDISAKIDRTVDRENDSCDKERPVASQNLLDIVPVNQLLDEETRNERQSQMFENEEQVTEISSKDQGTDEPDNCGSAIISEPIIEGVCDLFTDEKREQNISEFTVVKSVIKADKKQCQEPERTENSKDRDCVIDSKLLCMDSSDCGIYMEDRCANDDLMEISGHEFNEDDSMVLMKWEAGRIQEDAVNRLCGIDDTSIDFASVTNALQDSSLLDNLSISRTLIVKEPRALETIAELEGKSSNDEAVASAVESAPAAEESAKTPSVDETKEQDQVSSSSSYEKLAYLCAADCNANTKMVPKLVIKKNEASSKFVTQMGSSNVTKVDHKSISSPSHQPKIPKMIIRNARSRPGTPSIESVREDVPAQMNISDRASLTNEDLYENESEGSLQDGHRNKIPKMKIKLDEKHSSKIIRAEDTDDDLCARRRNIKKTVPKMKIKNSSRTDLPVDSSVCIGKSSQESSRRYEERIPILKLKKQERNRSLSPEVTRKRSGSSHTEVPSKKYKKAGRDETTQPTGRSSSSDSTRSTAAECEAKKNPLVCISEKIPKVIIKRTSASAEFKCELSKDCKKIIAKSAKWQPEVKLERYRNLDSMVKDLKLTLSPISLRAIEKIFAGRKDGHHQEKRGDHSLSRSSSASNLIPVKYNKQRRMSDYDYRKASESLRGASSPWNADSRDTKTYISPRKNTSSKSCGKSTDECQSKSKPQRSRSRDDDSLLEEDEIAPFDKESDQSFGFTLSISQHDEERKSRSFDIVQEAKADEDTTTPSNLSQKNISVECPGGDSANFKIALKEQLSKTESCYVKLPNLKEIFSEEIELRIGKERKKKQDSFLSRDKSKIVIKKERLSTSDIDSDDSTLQSVESLKDASDTLEDNFEVDNTVIKIESSDESQSTIEILPASPGDDRSELLESHIIENDDNDEQLYSADAIPTQFELELEITDNSNTDLLDVPMPKLDSVAYHGSCRVSTEESNSEQTSKAERYSKSESSSRDRNSIGKEKHATNTDVSGDDKSALRNNPVGSDVSTKAPCETSDFVATRKNFCCNDSLIKEVLAAKEALKKCLSLSRCESDAKSIARLKTAAEKKQGLSFDLNSLSETRSKSSEAPQGCHSDVAVQRSCVSAAGKPSKIESTSNVEKSNKKYSKQNKSSLVKKKAKLHEKSEKADSKEMMKRTYEYTTISLKAVKRSGQAASNENCVVNQNEKRKQNTKNESHGVLQSQSVQRKESNKLSSYKIPKISKSTHQGSNASANAKEIKTTKEDNMPILEPEVDVNFDASSDRDNSRSPPVITIHDSDDLDIAESKLMDDNVITSDNKVESDAKDVHKKGEMSVADFITQLAYHEKATIKHRRYCNLCERWFPNTSRHRRHLAGYQHRHIELTQRRSIHALFMLFTGKPCPRLSPANVVRNDCSVGELTPLQIAVQDITKCYDRTQQSPKKQNDT